MEPSGLADLAGRMGDWWNGFGSKSFAGMTLEDIIICVAVLAAAFLARFLISTGLVGRAGRWISHSHSKTADVALHGLTPAIRFVPFIIAAFAITAIVPASASTKATFFAVNRSLVVFALFWSLFGVIPAIFQGLETRSAAIGDAMAGWAVRVTRIIVFCLGAGVVLEIWNIHVGPVLAGLGLVGAAVALGAQDLFRNLIAGIFIIGEQRFENGDWIRVDGIVEGTVEMIGLRASKIRRFDLAPVYVPNSKLSDNALTNFSQMTHRRISWMIGLEYSTTVDQLRQIRDSIQTYIDGSDDFMHSGAAPTFVRIDSFGDSAINMMVYCFTRTTDWGAWLKIKEAFAYEIKAIVEKAGSGFAFPSQSLYVETLPDHVEVFPLQKMDGAQPGETSAANGKS